MNKQMGRLAVTLFGALLIASPVIGADYSSMTNEQLSALRGTFGTASPEEHAAFQQEWQSRLQEMTPAERQQYAGKPENAPQNGSGNQYGGRTPSGGSYGEGSGAGSGSGYGGGSGSGGGGGGGRR